MSDRKALARRVREALATDGLTAKMWGSTSRARRNRSEAIQRLHVDVHRMKADLSEMKTTAVGDRELQERFAAQVRANGGKVFFAKDGAAVVEYVTNLAKEHGAQLLAKSKSITSEEIELDHELEKRGITCVETDLGELVVQLAREKPVHLVMPAAHKSVTDVAKLVSERLGREVPAEPSAILNEVRSHLRPIFLSAKIGMTGANVGIAETGTVVIQTNEGNGRLVTGAPEINVVLIGVEKIVPSWEDAAKVVGAAAMSATGQPITVYVSGFSNRLPLGGEEGGRELHVLLLDNGRSRMLEDNRYSNALDCIRCGACMNTCPTYSVVGGHTFGYIYPGPIGIPWTSNIHGLDRADFADLCISCGLCKEVCPVDIDIPMMIAEVKQQRVDLVGQPIVNRFFAASEMVAKVASATAPLSNWAIKRKVVRSFMERAFGVDRRRTLPSFSRKRLRSRLKEVATSSEGRAGKVVYFPDIFADYNDPDLGLKAIGILRALGYRVEVPDLEWSGMPYLSYGEVRKSARVAERNLRILSRYVDDGYAVVATEPTATYMLRDAYLKLSPGEQSRRVAERSFPFFEFIEQKLEGLSLRAALKFEWGVGFHIPCHDRALSNGGPAVKFLEKAGYKVRVIETGTCCGMGGTFGMKAGTLGYDLSMAVGGPLFDLFKESGCEVVCTESSVCSAQIVDGTGLRVFHPLHLVEFVGSDAPPRGDEFIRRQAGRPTIRSG